VFRPGEMLPMFGDTAAVLVVDDDEFTCEILSRLLVGDGFDCTVAANATEARTRLAERKFALALVDVRLPGESGLELVSTIFEDNPDLAVVMVSGLDDPSLADLALQSGATGYVVKPFLASQVLITVRNASRQRCLEILGRVHLNRLHHLVTEQAADLEEALISIKETHRYEVAALADSEAKFRALIDAAPDAMVAVDPSGEIALVNAQAERLFGYGRDELVGQPIEMLVPDAFRHVHPRRRSGYFANPTPRLMGAGMQLAGRRKDGSEFPAEISLSSIHTADGLLVSAAVRDVSDRIEAQAERERMTAQAERERLESQLHQLQRLESLGQLAGSVAHDFNNLLGAIINYAAFIDEEIVAGATGVSSPDWGSMQHDVAQVRRAADRAAGLTHQLTVYGIVTQSGGHARLYSEPGLGTTFSAFLPATDQDHAHPDAQTDDSRNRGGEETVLVVEDEEGMREVTERILTRSGYQVLTAPDGLVALELVAHHPGPIDLLLTDVVMPHMLGKEVAERVMAARPGIRVLYMSGYAQPIFGAHGTLEAGVVLIEKPFTGPALLSKIAEVLDESPPHQG
jgi:PAS domain S-box-containing protein